MEIITPKGHRPDYLIQTTKEKRTIVATVLILLLIPLTLFIGEAYLAGRKYYFIALLVMFECMMPFF